MARTKTPKPDQVNSFVVQRGMQWGPYYLKNGDEFDCVKLGVAQFRYMQLLRTGKIKFGPVTRTHDDMMAAHEKLKELAGEDREVPDFVNHHAKLRSRGRGWFDVVVDDRRLNEKALLEPAATEMMDKYNKEQNNG